MSKPFDNNLTNVHSIAGGAFKIQMLKSISPLINTSFLIQQTSGISLTVHLDSRSKCRDFQQNSTKETILLSLSSKTLRLCIELFSIFTRHQVSSKLSNLFLSTFKEVIFFYSFDNFRFVVSKKHVFK